MSKGEVDLHAVLRSEFPHFPILAQHPIKVGKRTLYLDYYIPLAKMAFEYDGQGHFGYIPFFHGTKARFEHFVRNDEAKSQWCIDHEITLIRITYKDTVTAQTLRHKIAKCLNEINSTT